ncbi:hypothetical protein BBK14_29475 [Parafrankia soli]|uniref:Uncharacterized protein n=1 Tax=Parafrankia soli TaxID=2599596 RepID=A0A1S1PC11_9ACTN|nr:hypothetical protein [Parafrankia soli]OHV19240.1 hypothetical protein BBK14_29475 [Parafrankia soli]
MTDPARAARYALALLAGQLQVARHEDDPDTAALRAARRQIGTLIREASTDAPTETIHSVERLTVGLLLQLAKTTRACPQEMLRAIAVAHAGQATDPEPAVGLLTVRLDMATPTPASASTGWDALHEDLLVDAARIPQRTLDTLTKIAAALLVELADALRTAPEKLLARLAAHTPRGPDV